jgi:NTE family protein
LGPQSGAKEADGRPTVGLVLGGGGAKGLAHVGVIKVLEENHIPVDVISGTSMGAIVGSLYASGYTADELSVITNALDWNDVFNDKTARKRATFRRKSDEFGFLTDYKITFKDGQLVLPQGLIQGQNLFLELARLLSKTRSVGEFKDLPIPFRLVATDLSTGKPVVMKDGDLATAVFASMAIPGFLPPVEREGYYLVDGGVSNNVPINIARELGADIVIVVNVGTDPKPANEIRNFIDVLRQTQVLLTQDNTNFQISTMISDDVLILPDVKSVSVASFGKSLETMRAGQSATRDMLGALKVLQLDEKAWEAHIQARKKPLQKTPVISEIRVSQNSNLSDTMLLSGISVKPGEVLNTAQLNEDIDKLYGSGVFSRINYKIVEENDQSILQLNAKTKDTNDGYFKLGVSLDSNLENTSAFKLGVSYTKPQVNRWGGEWRSEITIGDTLVGSSEFYQPLGATQRFFVEPSVFVSRNKVDFFDDNDRRRGDLKALIYGGSLQSGVLFGRWGEFRVGAIRASGNLTFTDETLGFDQQTFGDSSLLARLSVDTLDNLAFPTSGALVVAEYQYHDDFLGGDFKFEQTSLQALKAQTFGRHTVTLGTRVSGASGRDANVLGTSDLGGFLSLSGFSEDEITGQYAAMVFGAYYYRLNQRSTLFDAPIYVGGSLEAGNVYQSFDSISFGDAIYAGSLFAGLKSPIGPIFIGVGHNDTGVTSLYFSVGSFF